MPIQFERGEWAFVVQDGAVNYAVEDYAAAVLEHPSIGIVEPLPVVVFQARHIETGTVINLTLQIPPTVLHEVSIVFAAMIADLEQRGVIT